VNEKIQDAVGKDDGRRSKDGRSKDDRSKDDRSKDDRSKDDRSKDDRRSDGSATKDARSLSVDDAQSGTAMLDFRTFEREDFGKFKAEKRVYKGAEVVVKQWR
jgi:hypothetical protein